MSVTLYPRSSLRRGFHINTSHASIRKKQQEDHHTVIAMNASSGVKNSC